MDEKEEALLLQNLQKEIDKNRTLLKRVKLNKTLYYYHYHVAKAIEAEIVLIKKFKKK